MGRIQRRLVKATLTVVSYPRLTLLLAAVVLAVSVWVALGRLTISTDQNNLFSDKVSFFRDYLNFVHQFPENEAIYVFVEAKAGQNPKVAQWMAISDEVTAALRAAPQWVKRVENRVSPAAMGENGFLFEEADKREESFAQYVEMTQLLRQIAEPPSALDRGVLGGTPVERFVRSMALGRVARPERFPDSARITAMFADAMSSAVKNPATPIKDTLPPFFDLDDSSPRRLGYFYESDAIDPAKHHLLVSVYHNDPHNSLTSISETVEGIRGIVAGVAAKHPEFFVGLTGRPALEADEMRTSDNDTRRAEIIAMICVFAGMIFFLTPWAQVRKAETWGQRWNVMLAGLWLALAAEVTLGVAIGWTFGWATFSVGELNLLSIVFVIALIGIGMDYLVQILTRYRREARRYVRQTAIWARVFRYVSPPISTACLGAAGAFLAMTLTDFRGAADLGVIAGGGLLLCLIGGYTVLPALLALFPPKLPKVEESERYADEVPASTRRGLIGPAAWMVLLAAGLYFMLQTHFDPDLLNLQSQNLESVQLVKHLSGTWSAVVLSEDIDLLRKVRSAVEQAPASNLIGSTDSILTAETGNQWLQSRQAKLPPIAWAAPEALKEGDVPGLIQNCRSLAADYEKLNTVEGRAAAASLRGFASTLEGANAAERVVQISRLNQWQPAMIDSLKGLDAQFRPRPIDFAELARRLPTGLRSHMVSESDAAGKPAAKLTYALYINANPRDDLWVQGNLEAFEKEVERRVATVPGAPAVTGISSNVYHTTASIRSSFYHATGYSLILIFLLVLLDLRNLGQTLAAISVLALGLPMLLALMGLFGISWNFANFFGLPILIGAGHEYGVFMIHRYREALHDPRRVWRTWDVSDRALLLCGFITTSSFAFLIPAQHRGVRSLGLVMALGTACIYLATLLVVRPILRYRLTRKNIYKKN